MWHLEWQPQNHPTTHKKFTLLHPISDLLNKKLACEGPAVCVFSKSQDSHKQVL